VFSSSLVRPREIDCDEKESAEIRIGLEKARLLEAKRLRATAQPRPAMRSKDIYCVSENVTEPNVRT
jgi:hypothetical protein